MGCPTCRRTCTRPCERRGARAALGPPRRWSPFPRPPFTPLSGRTGGLSYRPPGGRRAAIRASPRFAERRSGGRLTRRGKPDPFFLDRGGRRARSRSSLFPGSARARGASRTGGSWRRPGGRPRARLGCLPLRPARRRGLLRLRPSRSCSATRSRARSRGSATSSSTRRGAAANAASAAGPRR